MIVMADVKDRATELGGNNRTNRKSMDCRSRLSLLFQLKEQIESNQSEFGAMQGAWIVSSTQLR